MSQSVDTKPGPKSAAKTRLTFMIVALLVILAVSKFRDSQTSFIGYLSMFPTYIVALMMRRGIGRVAFLTVVVGVLFWSTSGDGSDLWPLYFWVPVPAAGLVIRSAIQRFLAKAGAPGTSAVASVSDD